MRLKSILKWHQHRKDLGVLLALLLCLKDSLLSSFAEKGFSEVADWLRVQESLKWALAGFAESWACRLWQTQLSTRTQRKENKTKVKGCKETRWFFLLIMVATGWVWSRAHGWRESSFFQRVHFQREGEFKREEFLKGQLESGFKRKGGEVCPGYLTSAFDTSQWLSWPIRSYAGAAAALLLHPLNKLTCHGQSHCPNFTFSCKVSFWMWFL